MARLIEWLWDHSIEAGVALTMLAVFALFAAVLQASVEEQREWEAFKKEHNCSIVGRKQAQVHTGVATAISANGSVGVAPVTTVSSAQVAYQCEDGFIYWRNE